MQLKKECYYLKLFGYTNIRIIGILLVDVCFDLAISLFVVLPAELILWRYIQKIDAIQTLLLLTESGTDVKYIMIWLVYGIIMFISLLQIVIRKEMPTIKNKADN